MKQRKSNEFKSHVEVKRGLETKVLEKLFTSSDIEVFLLRNQIDEAALISKIGVLNKCLLE